MNELLEHPDRTDELEEFMLSLPQVECETVHLFAKDTYVRQITMPAGSIILGHRHLTGHVNNIVRGRALVSQDGVVEEMVAPHVFVSEPGVRKALHVIEETVWQTVHVVDLPEPPTTPGGTDAAVALLEGELIEKSPAWLQNDRQKKLQEDIMKLVEMNNERARAQRYAGEVAG